MNENVTTWKPGHGTFAPRGADAPRPDSPRGVPLQRTSGEGRIAVAWRGGRTRLAGLREAGAAKLRLPRSRDALEAVLINTAGGLTDGDRLRWHAEAGPACDLTLTTQACEKVYRAAGPPARLDVTLRADGGARLAWLPQETILFDRAALHRTLTVDLAPDATFVACEAVLLGRRAMGERVSRLDFRDTWRVRVAGRPVHAEALALDLDGKDDVLARPAVLGGHAAFATLLAVGPPAEAWLAPARAILDGAGGSDAGAAALVEVAGSLKLVIRLTAPDGLALRRRLVPLVSLLQGGRVPRVWST